MQGGRRKQQQQQQQQRRLQQQQHCGCILEENQKKIKIEMRTGSFHFGAVEIMGVHM
jgi:hypothetical protein